MVALGGCVDDEVGPSLEALSEGRRLTAREGEALYQQSETVIGPRADVEALTGAGDRGLTSDATTVIDATEGRSIFPMPAEIRRFNDRNEMAIALRAELGAVVDAPDAEGRGVAFRVSYAMYGSSFWTDPSNGVRYRVSDPIAAYVGGVTGQVDLGDERVCMDPDGHCADSERASYLEPEGTFTAPHTVYVPGTNGVVATFHTFFNKTWFPWPWARHGNRTHINFAALPSTQLTATGHILTFYGGVGWVQTGMPSSTVNHHEVEVSLQTGWPGDVIFDASAACGWGQAADPDVSGSARTGNGPDNPAMCPS